jgi:hypothetical protein
MGRSFPQLPPITARRADDVFEQPAPLSIDEEAYRPPVRAPARSARAQTADDVPLVTPGAFTPPEDGWMSRPSWERSRCAAPVRAVLTDDPAMVQLTVVTESLIMVLGRTKTIRVQGHPTIVVLGRTRTIRPER